MSRRSLFIPLVIAFGCLFAQAADKHEDLDAISDAATHFLTTELGSYGDRANFRLGRLDNRLGLPACAKLDVQLPAGNRLVGNTSLRVKCAKGANWAVNLPVAISIQSDYWVTSRTLPNGHEITESDIEKRTGDLGQLPPNAVVDYTQAIGRTLQGGAPAGAPLRADMLRAPYAVKANEMVKVLAHGSGFEVASEGRAMANASDGQPVKVKMISGAVVQGTAHDGGMVEIKY